MTFTIHPTETTLRHNVTWQEFENILVEKDNRPGRITYDCGTLELMSPSYRHERYKRFIGRFIDILAEELNLALVGGGSTTFKRQDLARGLEPDECYYIQNAAAILGKPQIDLSIDPPPDLVVEIDITSTSINRMAIYAVLGVVEIWRYDGTNLKVYQLAGRDYEVTTKSSIFPALPISEFTQFLTQIEATDDITLFRLFRRWVKSLEMETE